MAVIGAFMFRNEGDGCISSKYLNQTLHTPLMECARFKSKSPSNEFILAGDQFCGIYETVWLEHGSKPKHGELAINKRSNSIYVVNWSIKRTIYFTGEAMIVDGLLMGWYTDFSRYPIMSASTTP